MIDIRYLELITYSTGCTSSDSIAHEYQHRHLLPMSISTDEIMYAIAMWLPRCMPLPRYAMPHNFATFACTCWTYIYIYIYIYRSRERLHAHVCNDRIRAPVGILFKHSFII